MGVESNKKPFERVFNETVIFLANPMATPIQDYKDDPYYQEWNKKLTREVREVYKNQFGLRARHIYEEGCDTDPSFRVDLGVKHPRIDRLVLDLSYPGYDFFSVEDIGELKPESVEIWVHFSERDVVAENLIKRPDRRFTCLEYLMVEFDQTANVSQFTLCLNKHVHRNYHSGNTFTDVLQDPEQSLRIIDLSYLEKQEQGAGIRLHKTMKNDPTYWYPLIGYFLDLSSTQNPKIPRFSDIMAGIQRANRDKERNC